jgi:hypothetical protein
VALNDTPSLDFQKTNLVQRYSKIAHSKKSEGALEDLGKKHVKILLPRF